jgi:uncharacterized protein
MIRLDVSRIKNNPGASQRLVKDFEMQPVKTGLEEIHFNTPVRLDVSVTNRGSSIELSGLVEATIKLACGRCLELFDLPVREEINEFYFNAGKQDIKTGEDGEGWIPYRGESIDATPEVVRTILASLPMKLVCREDCRGLCQVCGRNMNLEECDCGKDEIDIRLIKLKQLMDKEQ